MKDPAALKKADRFQRFANAVADKCGTSKTFIAALLVVAVWAIAGPLFHFSDGWQLTINTGTTIITFLMVFLIQATQNRDARAIHLKLDELIRTSRARNAFADLQHASEEELEAFEDEFKSLRQQGLSRAEAAHRAGARAHDVRSGKNDSKPAPH
ncbi:MAG: low affinity iron permease family protein [Myxococcaceae bacterium]